MTVVWYQKLSAIPRTCFIDAFIGDRTTIFYESLVSWSVTRPQNLTLFQVEEDKLKTTSKVSEESLNQFDKKNPKKKLVIQFRAISKSFFLNSMMLLHFHFKGLIVFCFQAKDFLHFTWYLYHFNVWIYLKITAFFIMINKFIGKLESIVYFNIKYCVNITSISKSYIKSKLRWNKGNWKRTLQVIRNWFC